MLKRNGKLLSDFPSLNLLFNHCGYDITVSITGVKSPEICAKSSFRLSQDVEMTLYTEGVISKLVKMVGMQEIQIGNYDFDNAFIIKGSDESFVKRFLTLDVQKKLLSLKKKYLYLRITQTKFELTHDNIPRDTESWDSFLNAVFLLIESLHSLGLKA